MFVDSNSECKLIHVCIDTDIYMLVHTSTKFLIQYNNTYIAIISLHACIQQFLEEKNACVQ